MSDIGNKEIFSRNLKHYMQEKGIDRVELCNKLDLKYTTFCDWINATKYPRIDKIELLANFFGIQKSDLIESHDRAAEQDRALQAAKVALFSGATEVTDEMWEEVKNFAKYVESREKNKNDKVE